MDEPLSLWWAALDDASSSTVALDLSATLSPHEERRADRLKHPLDRDRFRTARGWLRRVLAAELGCTPEEVTFLTDDGGKPRVAGSALRFSAARSEGVAVFVVSRCMEVGVDVEAIRPSVDVAGVARRFFTAAEQQALDGLSPDRRARAFYDCWTRKEAYVKGTGAGLSIDLRTVDVWPGEGGAAMVGGWSIHQVDVTPGFSAAVAGGALGAWPPPAPVKLTCPGPDTA